MTGSEKQVAWASEIKANFTMRAEQMIAWLNGEWVRKWVETSGYTVEDLAEARQMISEILAKDDAKFWIDNREHLFSNVRFQFNYANENALGMLYHEFQSWERREDYKRKLQEVN